MSKYIRLAARPACTQRLLPRAFWLTVWLSISPMAMSSQAPNGPGNEAAPETSTQSVPDSASGDTAPKRRLPADYYRATPPATKIPVIILWDETGKTGAPGSGPIKLRASITTCRKG